MLSKDLGGLTETLRGMAKNKGGQLVLSPRQTEMLIDNLMLLTTDLFRYEKSHGPIEAGKPNIAAIQRAMAEGKVVNIADVLMERRTGDHSDNDGGNAA